MSSSDQIKEALQALFLSFPAQERTDNERELVKVYLIASSGIEPGFVAMACRRFISGQVQHANLTFRPTPAEVASEARRLEAAARETKRIGQMSYPPERKRLTGPRQPFTPYPKLWDALAGDTAALDSLQSMTFDQMTQASKLFATEGVGKARDWIMVGAKRRNAA